MRTTQLVPRVRRRRGGRLIAGVLAGALGCAACSSSSKSSTSATSSPTATSSPSATSSSTPVSGGGGIPAGPIKVGIIAALSGPNAAVGKLVTTDAQAIIDSINSSGGIAGHQVSLTIENSEGDPATAAAAARKFVSEHVVATLYNGSTAEGKDQVVAIEQQAHIVGVSEESLDKYDDANQYPYYFNVNPIDSQTTDSLASFAKQKGYNQVGELGDGTPFAASLEQNFQKSASSSGITVVKTVDYPTTSTNMTTQLSQLQQAGAKTLALWCEVGCGQALDSLHQLNWRPVILSGDLLSLLAFSSIKDLGPTTFESCPISDTPGQQPPAAVGAVVNLVAPKFGGPSALDFGFIEEADELGVLKAAVESANSVDGAALKQALESLKDKKFTNPDAKYTFSAQHHTGFQADTANGQIPVCGLSQLGALDLPVKVPS